MPTYAPNLVSVPCQNGIGASVLIVDAALFGRHWIPQPFNDSLTSRFEGSTVVFPQGYVNLAYNESWTFIGTPVVTFYSGTMPPGLALSTPTAYTWTITGTPTTVGTYIFSLKVVTGGTSGFINLQVPILPEPDSGTGGVGGS